MGVIAIQHIDNRFPEETHLIGIASCLEYAHDMVDEYFGEEMMTFNEIDGSDIHGCVGRLDITILQSSEVGMDNIYFIEYELDEL